MGGWWWGGAQPNNALGPYMNTQKRILRQSVECAIRVDKEGLGSNSHKRRISITNADSRYKCALSVKCAFYHQFAIHNMRCQRCTSNPAVLNPSGPRGHVDDVDKVINMATGNTFSTPGRANRFYGPLRNGDGHVFPRVIPFTGFPVHVNVTTRKYICI